MLLDFSLGASSARRSRSDTTFIGTRCEERRQAAEPTIPAPCCATSVSRSYSPAAETWLAVKTLTMRVDAALQPDAREKGVQTVANPNLSFSYYHQTVQLRPRKPRSTIASTRLAHHCSGCSMAQEACICCSNALWSVVCGGTACCYKYDNVTSDGQRQSLSLTELRLWQPTWQKPVPTVLNTKQISSSLSSHPLCQTVASAAESMDRELYPSD